MLLANFSYHLFETIGTVAGLVMILQRIILKSILSSKGELQLNFKDRLGAGVVLANVLRFTIKRKKGKEKDYKILVLGIPRGGVIVADIVAKKLSADIDIVIPRKLTDTKDLSIISKFQLEAALYEQ